MSTPPILYGILYPWIIRQTGRADCTSFNRIHNCANHRDARYTKLPIRNRKCDETLQKRIEGATMCHIDRSSGVHHSTVHTIFIQCLNTLMHI